MTERQFHFELLYESGFIEIGFCFGKPAEMNK